MCHPDSPAGEAESTRRAQYGALAFDAYAVGLQVDDEDPALVLADLLADLRHFAVDHGLDFDAALERYAAVAVGEMRATHTQDGLRSE